jgi:histidine triad (HIT) family protein
MAKDCIFCIIAGKKKKEDIVYEDDTFIAFRDADPSAPVHLLIIPKSHVGISGGDLDERCDVSCKVFEVARKIAKEMGVSDSYKLLMNAGYSATETPNHLHIHLIGGWKSPTEVRHV